MHDGVGSTASQRSGYMRVLSKTVSSEMHTCLGILETKQSMHDGVGCRWVLDGIVHDTLRQLEVALLPVPECSCILNAHTEQPCTSVRLPYVCKASC